MKVCRCMKIEAAAQNGARCGLMGSWTMFHLEWQGSSQIKSNNDDNDPNNSNSSGCISTVFAVGSKAYVGCMDILFGTEFFYWWRIGREIIPSFVYSPPLHSVLLRQKKFKIVTIKLLPGNFFLVFRDLWFCSSVVHFFNIHCPHHLIVPPSYRNWSLSFTGFYIRKLVTRSSPWSNTEFWLLETTRSGIV